MPGMTKPSSFVFDATHDNFQPLVVENLRRGPVLVNFWAVNPRIALEQLLEIVRRDRDRGHGEDLGRKSMIALFNMLGEHPLWRATECCSPRLCAAQHAD